MITATDNSIDVYGRAELLAEAARKPIRRLHQFDCFLHVEPGDCIIVPDKDGDSLFQGVADELRNSGTDMIRVHIPIGTERGDAIRALKKIAAWIKEDEGVFQPSPIPEDCGREFQKFPTLREPTHDESYKCYASAPQVIERATEFINETRAF